MEDDEGDKDRGKDCGIAALLTWDYETGWVVGDEASGGIANYASG